MQTFNVEKMMCGGCVSAVEKALQRLDGVEKVVVDLDTKTATVDGSVDSDRVIAALTEAGYPATLVD